MCGAVGRKPSNAGRVIGTVNLSTVSTHLKAVELNECLLSGVLTPQSSELTDSLLRKGNCNAYHIYVNVEKVLLAHV